MKNLNDLFANQEIINIAPVEDYWQIETTTLWISIFNPFVYVADNGVKTPFNEMIVERIIGEHISSVQHNDSELLIDLQRGVIIISLKDVDFSGPEAVYISEKDGDTNIVFQ